MSTKARPAIVRRRPTYRQVRLTRSSRLASLVALALLTFCFAIGRANADEVASNKTRAQALHAEGLALAREGELAAAARAFEAAYRTQPNYSVLYNLGQAQRALGRVVEATNTFFRYLSEGRDSLDPARRAHVEKLLAECRRRIGSVTLHIHPSDAEVFVDGASLGRGPFQDEVVLEAGERQFVITKTGYFPHVAQIAVRPEQATPVSVKLEAPVMPPAEVRVRCELPSVTVTVDGVAKGVTPLTAPLLVPPGVRRVRLSRAGYRDIDRVLETQSGSSVELACPFVPSGSALGGPLDIHGIGPRTSVVVDGEPYRGQKLPVGPHVLNVDATGFHPWRGVISLDAGRRREVRLQLEPTHAHVAAFQDASRHKMNWAVGLATAAVVFIGSGAALFVSNQEAHDEWIGARNAVERELDRNGYTASIATQNAALRDRAATIQRTDDIAAGLWILGAAFGIGSGILWWQSGGEPRPD